MSYPHLKKREKRRLTENKIESGYIFRNNIRYIRLEVRERTSEIQKKNWNWNTKG